MGEPEQKRPVIRFFWNGIKVNGGPMVLVWYSHDSGERYGMTSEPERISVAAQGYELPAVLAPTYPIINRSDSLSDYFDRDRIHIRPEHGDWPAVAAAYAKSLERKILRLKRRAAKVPSSYNLGEVTGTEQTLATFKERHLPEPAKPTPAPGYAWAAPLPEPDLAPDASIPYPEWFP